ncbi:MAG: glycosyltransferase family 39 protein [Candidatus Daviesbacteria bacterium]|nr:glycosyltransferase family 39 protein [Candidatus Daviesbacteria bacterium]
MSLKNNWKIYLILLVTFSIVIFIRFYNFSNRINFGPEQAISLITTGEYIKDKITLIGLPSTQRVTSTGHIIFSSPIFNYALIPLELIFNFDPILITGYFALLNIITGLIIYLLTKKIFSVQVALFAVILFLFNGYMIYHSLFIWIVNYLPLLGLLTIYLLFLFRQKNRKIFSLALGLISGIAFGTEYLYLFTAVFVLLFLIYYSKNKFKDFIIFMLGFAVGNLPLILFDLKHNFYYFGTLYQYLIDTINSPGQSKLSYYHFLQFWPLLTIIGGVILYKIFRINKYIALLLIALYIFMNLTSPLVSFNEAVGMNKGLNYNLLNKAAQIIADNKPEKFNVATTWDFDSQAHPLRYLLRFRYEMIPLGIEEYRNADNIYVMTNPTYDINNASLYEISSFRPFKTELLTNLSNDYSVFKLNHLNK